MKLLITGIPGTGKTTIGNYLKSEKGYEHFDMEATLKKHGAAGLKMAQDFIEIPGDKKVVTWGFIPQVDDTEVKKWQDFGYKMIWFDGDRQAARREFLKRGDIGEDLFDMQIRKIEQFNVDAFKPVYINTFDENGIFLEKDKIVQLVIEK